MNKKDYLGFNWSPLEPGDIPRDKEDKAVLIYALKRSIVRYVYDAAHLEGNPMTFPEVMTVMEGVTVGGHALHDHEMVQNLKNSVTLLCDLLQKAQFDWSCDVFRKLNAMVSCNESLEWGVFRGEGIYMTTPTVTLSENEDFYPPVMTEKGAKNLINRFNRAVSFLKNEVEPYERALAFFLFAAREQFFFDGNKRTGRLMMNGELIEHGYGHISIPASSRLAFNKKMVDFYRSGDASEMMRFLNECYVATRPRPTLSQVKVPLDDTATSRHDEME